MTRVGAYVVVFAVVALVTGLCTPIVRHIAFRIGAVQKPDAERRVHKRPTPVLGGIAMLVGLLVGMTVAWRMGTFSEVFGGPVELYVAAGFIGVFAAATNTPLACTVMGIELFGTGVDAGQTTFRLRHAWGELGKVGAGQTWSPFMDIDVFPNSIEYWGPNGMVFFRNVQLRFTPWSDGDSRFAIALERPGASADQGVYAGRIELEGVTGRFPLPDLSAHFRKAGGFGHVQIAGIVRQMKWDDTNDDRFDLSGDAVGWGVNVTGNLKLDRHVARLGVVYGEGIQNYMNDAPVDVGIQNNFSNPRTPVVGKALPMLGISALICLPRCWMSCRAQAS